MVVFPGVPDLPEEPLELLEPEEAAKGAAMKGLAAVPTGVSERRTCRILPWYLPRTKNRSCFLLRWLHREVKSCGGVSVQAPLELL